MLHMPTPMLMMQGGPVVGQRLFTSSGSFVVPSGVSSICAVVISKGSDGGTDGETYAYGGQGGSLRYLNAIGVTEGETLTVELVNVGFDQQYARLRRASTDLVAAYVGAGTDVGLGFDGGYSSDPLGTGSYAAGGGAGGFTSGGSESDGSYNGGGGVSPYGDGAGGKAGASLNFNGALYGGGGAAGYEPGYPGAYFGSGALGCAYLLWGFGRAFPSTNVFPV